MLLNRDPSQHHDRIPHHKGALHISCYLLPYLASTMDPQTWFNLPPRLQILGKTKIYRYGELEVNQWGAVTAGMLAG
jgi:hypothetical protein